VGGARTSRCASVDLSRWTTVSFSIKRGEILGMIGPKGQAKTTCSTRMKGVYRPLRRGADGGPAAGASAEAPDHSRQRPHLKKIPACRRDDPLGGNVVVGTDAGQDHVVGALVRSPANQRGGGGRRSRSASERAGVVGIADRAADKARNLPTAYRAGWRSTERGHRADSAVPGRARGGFQPGKKEENDGPDPPDPDDGYTVLLSEHDMRRVLGSPTGLVVWS